MGTNGLHIYKHIFIEIYIYLVPITSQFIGSVESEGDSNKWTALLNIFRSELLEEGSPSLRKKTNQTEKSVS